MKVMHAGENQS